MQTLTIQITNEGALKTIHALEERKAIKVIDNVSLDSPSVPGKPLSLKAFKSWIMESEEAPTVSLKEAKFQWKSKMKRLQRLTK